jgi:hypothetical protein
LAPRLHTLFALAALLTTVCSPSVQVGVASLKPNKENPGGGSGAGSGGGALPDGSVELPDGSVPDGSTASLPDCNLCGDSTDTDAGCPTNLTATTVTTETGIVCLCEDQFGNSGCELCSDANPQNGGCDAGSCTDICAPGGDFELCVATGVTVPDECYPPTDGG